jgi:hypothetical protein
VYNIHPCQVIINYIHILKLTTPKDPIWLLPELETALEGYLVDEHGSRAVQKGIGADNVRDVVVIASHFEA